MTDVQEGMAVFDGDRQVGVVTEIRKQATDVKICVRTLPIAAARPMNWYSPKQFERQYTASATHTKCTGCGKELA